jgi:hypothetical protein
MATAVDADTATAASLPIAPLAPLAPVANYLRLHVRPSGLRCFTTAAHTGYQTPVRSVAALPEDAGLAESRGVMFKLRGSTGT